MLLLLLSAVSAVVAWPDGAPCVHAAFESMNPLEAVEHQGGLQLDAPPYEIIVDQKCYWRNQPIALTLQGKNESIWFKGFVIQPFKWNNDQLGERIGQLVRLDDNGSWQQQCFRFKDSATHSHNEKKKHMRMWWRVDDETDTVQFVATVVKHQTQFWVRSVRSNPIPPCRLQRYGISDYTPPLPSIPPPVKPFKMETHREFDQEGIAPRVSQVQQIQQRPQTLAPTTAAPVTRAPNSVPQQMRQIIPISSMETIHSHLVENDATTTSPRPLIATTRAQLAFQNRRVSVERPQPRPVARPVVAPVQAQNLQCLNRDTPQRCGTWVRYCRTPQFIGYMSTYCRQTCGLC